MDFEISRQRHRAVWARRCYLLPASDAASGPAPLPTRLISCVPGKMMPPIGRCRYYYYYVNVSRDVAGGVNHLRLRSETTPGDANVPQSAAYYAGCGGATAT
jgi:hypothetical protein